MEQNVFPNLKNLCQKSLKKCLHHKLRALENDGLINRKVYPVVPPKVEYNLSEFGKTFLPVLQAMCDFGNAYINEKRNNLRQ